MTRHLLFMTLLKSCINFDQNYHLVSSERSVTRTDVCQSNYYHNIGDEICDDDLNHKECDWDGGDCCGNNIDTIYCSVCQCLDPEYTGYCMKMIDEATGCTNFCPEEEMDPEDCNAYEVHCPSTNLTNGCKDPAFCVPISYDYSHQECENSCNPRSSPICQNHYVYCSNPAINGCEQLGYCLPVKDSYMDTNCQIDLYNTPMDVFHNFTRNCSENGGESLGKAKICIPHQYTYNIKLSPKGSQNDVSIELSNIQITEIGDKLGQLTLIMDLEVHWNDNRIQLIKENVPIFLSNEDQNHIWSPQFRIGTDLISHNKQGDDEIILIKEYLSNQSYVVSAHKLTYLSTTFKCEMNLKDYPFDYHNCTIEVSIL